MVLSGSPRRADGSYAQPERLGQPLTVTDNLGKTTHMRYDAQGHLVQTQDALGNVATADFNLADQPWGDWAPPTGNTGSGSAMTDRTYLYPGGPLTKVEAKNEAGAVVRTVNLAYGPEGETLSRTGSAETVTLAYDAAYATKTLKDGNNAATTYWYDLNGRPTQIDYPLASGASYDRVKFTSYDAVGNLLSRTDGNGQVTNYAYADTDGLLSAVGYVGASAYNVALTYDAYDRLTGWTDGAGAYARSYDDGDRLIASDCTYTGQPTRSIGYGYWPDGSRHTLLLPANYWVYTNYDAVGRWAQVAVTGDYDVQATYYDNGWQASRTVNNGLATTYAYNAVGALASQTNAVGSTTVASYGSLAYDGVFNLTGMSAAVNGVAAHSGTVAYAYDAKDRLTGETSTRLGGYSQTHGYDAAGNPSPLRGTALAYDADNRRTGTGFAYDGNGSPTTYSGTAQAFDPEARLTSRGSTWSAGYRADGLRAWKSVNGARTYFLYDEATGDPAEEYNAAGTLVARNAHAPDGLVGQKKSSAWTFYAYDPQGSVAQRTTSSGSVVSSAAYDAYGAESVSGAAPTDPFGYNAQSGYYYDRESSLYYCEQRYYDPSAGRWVTRDPIGYGGGINLYGYCGGKPLGNADPSGLELEIVEYEYASDEIKALRAILAKLKNADPHTRQLLYDLIRSKTKYQIRPKNKCSNNRHIGIGPHTHSKENTVYFDPMEKVGGQPKGENGASIPFPADSNLLHELGHLGPKRKDDPGGGVNGAPARPGDNVWDNENPFRRWAKYPRRVKY